MKFKPQYPEGATPIDPDELDGLLPDFIDNQDQLNILEQENILKGKNWALKTKKEILSELFVRELHKKMYCDVWKWAGKYRKTQKSIGVDSSQISTQIYLLMENVKSWIELQSYAEKEILSRFHHQLVFIHPFVNGNGRYARLHTELLAEKMSQEIPTWGARSYNGKINFESEIRNKYIMALKAADGKNINLLNQFLYS